MHESKRFFRAAGFVFTYALSAQRKTTRLEMWRENGVTGERHWVTVTLCPAERPKVYAAALALVAWVLSLEVAPRKELRAQAAAECLALTQDRMSRVRTRANPALALAFHSLLAGRPAAA